MFLNLVVDHYYFPLNLSTQQKTARVLFNFDAFDYVVHMEDDLKILNMSGPLGFGDLSAVVTKMQGQVPEGTRLYRLDPQNTTAFLEGMLPVEIGMLNFQRSIHGSLVASWGMGFSKEVKEGDACNFTDHIRLQPYSLNQGFGRNITFLNTFYPFLGEIVKEACIEDRVPNFNQLTCLINDNFDTIANKSLNHWGNVQENSTYVYLGEDKVQLATLGDMIESSAFKDNKVKWYFQIQSRGGVSLNLNASLYGGKLELIKKIVPNIKTLIVTKDIAMDYALSLADTKNYYEEVGTLFDKHFKVSGRETSLVVSDDDLLLTLNTIDSRLMEHTVLRNLEALIGEEAFKSLPVQARVLADSTSEYY